ncbi:MAG TPA: hypothetical protein VFF36_09100, partial [Planctomycetota bacterium]|nr:hypothetical protein [Planctomycetota bacterium]
VQASLQVLAGDLGRVLGDLGLPPLAKDARVDVTLGGTIARPEANGRAVIHGLGAQGRVLPELEARFSLQDGAARIDSLTGAAFGGTLRAKGEVRLYEKTTRHMLRSPVVDLAIAARDLDVSAVAGSKAVAGRVSFDGRAQGPLDAVTASLTVPAGSKLQILDDDYALGPVDVGLTANEIAVNKLHLGRKLGGALDVRGTMGVAKQTVALDVTLTRFPLAGIPGLADAAVPVSGFVGAKLHVAGRPELPTVAGTIDLTDVVARGVRLGDGHLVVSPEAAPSGAEGQPGTVALTGQMFDRFRFSGQAALEEAGPRVHGAMTFDRVALEQLAPEIGELGDGRGLASGEVTVDISPDEPLAVDLLLRELSLSIAREVEGDEGETAVQRVHVEAAQPVHVAMHGSEVTLEEALFTTDGGGLRALGHVDLAGAGGAGVVKGEVQGHVDMEILQPFLRGTMEKMSGDLTVELDAAGTLDKPLLQGR